MFFGLWTFAGFVVCVWPRFCLCVRLFWEVVMFGTLRRLLMSGDVRGLLEGSRRAFQDLVMGSPVPNERSRARALEAVNEAGGFPDRGPSQRERGYFGNEAFEVDPAFYGNERYVDPFSDSRATEFYGQLPQGGFMTFNPRTGARATNRFGDSQWSGGLAAPYEGFRVWPETYGGAAVSRTGVPPWTGAGSPPPSFNIVFPSGSVAAPAETAPYFSRMADDMWGADAGARNFAAGGAAYLPPSPPTYYGVDPYGYTIPGTFADENWQLRSEFGGWNPRDARGRQLPFEDPWFV